MTMATWASEASRAMTNMVVAEMAETPLARPSSPSMRFTELVMATIQRIVKGTDSPPSTQYRLSEKILGLEKARIVTPWVAGIAAATICTTNFSMAGKAMMSSTTPSTTLMTAPSRMLFISEVMGTNNKMLTMKPMKIARPPRRGIGTLCIRRPSLGTSMAPTL